MAQPSTQFDVPASSYPFRYRLYGTTVASAVELPGVPQDVATGHPAEAEIRWGTVPRELPHARVATPYFQAVGDTLLLDIAGTARYAVARGQSITIETYPDAAMERVRLFLLGSALGALMYQRGHLLLHGSAVDTPHGAMIFVGPQGEGKSTLAAHLHRRGYPLLCDDVCAVLQDAAGGYQIIPSLPQLRLCTDALERLAQMDTQARSADFEVDKFVVSLHQAPVRQTRRPGAIHLLSSHAGASISLEPLRGFARLHALVSNLYRPEYLPGLDSQAAVMQLANGAAGAVPFVQVRRPRDAGRMDELMDQLETHWHTLPVQAMEQAQA